MNDYPIHRLGDLVKPVQDRIPDRINWHFDKYIAGEHIDSGEVRVKKYGLIKGNEEVIGSAFHMRFRPGHVLYSTRRAYLRKAGIVDFEGICSNVTLVLQADGEKLLQSLLPFVLQSEDFVQFAISHSIGSTNPFVKWTDLSKYRIKLPPLNIQEKISQILWAIEGNVEKTENFIQVTEKLKKGLLEELLTRGIGHKRFRKTELGEIPANWELLRLSECVEMLPGYPFEATYFNDKKEGVPVIRIRDLLKSTISTFYSGEYDHKYLTTKGDILVGMDGEFETIKWSNSDALINQRICKIESSSEYLENDFLFYYLAPVIKSIETSIMGTTVKHLSINDIRKLMIPIPPLSEQNQIAKILSNTDNQLMELHNYLYNISNLKKKLTDSFLSGELLVSKEGVN